MILLFAVLLLSAVFSTKISSRFGLPVLLAFIGVGILAGSDALNLIYFDDAALTKRIADILLIFILFDGGFRTSRKDLAASAGPALGLATLGILATALVLGLLIHFVIGYELLRSFLIAAIISSTDAAAVMLITRQNPLAPRVSATISVESAANDPMAILLTLAFIDALAGPAPRPAAIALAMLWQFAGGMAIGWLAAKAAARLFEALDSENRGYYYVLAVAVILLAYGAADIVKANGIIAVFFAGYWLGNSEFPGKNGVSNFLDGISSFGNVSLFLLLGLLSFPSRFPAVWKEGLAIAAFMIFLARPFAVWLCTLPFGFSFKERLLIAWGGIKGAVPIVLSTYPAAYGLDPEGRIFTIIFFAVLCSCILQGMSLMPLASRLGLCLPAKKRPPHSIELHALRKSDIGMFEYRVEAGTAVEGMRIKDLRLKNETIISSVIRGDRIVPPRGDTILYAEDVLYLLAPNTAIESTLAEFSLRRKDLDRREALEEEIESRR